jgi:hypothetical protein
MPSVMMSLQVKVVLALINPKPNSLENKDDSENTNPSIRNPFYR